GSWFLELGTCFVVGCRRLGGGENPPCGCRWLGASSCNSEKLFITLSAGRPGAPSCGNQQRALVLLCQSVNREHGLRAAATAQGAGRGMGPGGCHPANLLAAAA